MKVAIRPGWPVALLRRVAGGAVWVAAIAAAVMAWSRVGVVSWLTVRTAAPVVTVQPVPGDGAPLAPGRPARWVWAVTNHGSGPVTVGIRVDAAGALAGHLTGRLWPGANCASGPAPAVAWAGPGPLAGLQAPVGTVVAPGATLPVCLEATLPASAGNDLQGQAVAVSLVALQGSDDTAAG